jgi:plastocyanin
LRSRSSSRRALALATVGVCLAAVGAPAPAGTAAPARTERVTRVTVKMVEYRFVLSVKKVRTGTVVFIVINKGQLAHIFAIPRLHKITPLMQPGRRYTLRVKFGKRGRYDYICPVGAHVQYGMAGTLRVTA